MLTAAYVGTRTIALRAAQAPPPGPDEVRIRVAFVGLCGTDLHIVHGSMDKRVQVPLVFGHEMSGTVDAIGDGVDGWAVGDKVTVMPLVWDGTCPACRAGNMHICQNLNFVGIDSPGALQALWNVPASTLVRLPKDIDLQAAALIEPVAVAGVTYAEVGCLRETRSSWSAAAPSGCSSRPLPGDSAATSPSSNSTQSADCSQRNSIF